MKSERIRIDCNLAVLVDAVVKKNSLYGTRRKFIELAIIEKINRVKK